MFQVNHLEKNTNVTPPPSLPPSLPPSTFDKLCKHAKHTLQAWSSNKRSVRGGGRGGRGTMGNRGIRGIGGFRSSRGSRVTSNITQWRLGCSALIKVITLITRMPSFPN